MKTDRDTGIMYERWVASPCEAVVLLVHGLGAHSGRWKFLAEFLHQYNYSSYLLELKGFGQTQDARGDIDSFDTYYQDIECLHEIAVNENPGKRIFLLGESMGALLAFTEAVLHPGLFDGLICLSPAFDSKLSISFFTLCDFMLSLLVNPKKHFRTLITSAMCTRDVEFQKVIDDDPMNVRSATARFLFQIFHAQRKVKKLAAQLKLPTLFMLAGADEVVSSELSRKIFQRIFASDKNLIEYPGMAHALSIDLEKEKVFGDIILWLYRHKERNDEK